MKPNAVRKPEQIKLIMECLQSGLSDFGVRSYKTGLRHFAKWYKEFYRI